MRYSLLKYHVIIMDTTGFSQFYCRPRHATFTYFCAKVGEFTLGITHMLYMWVALLSLSTTLSYNSFRNIYIILQCTHKRDEMLWVIKDNHLLEVNCNTTHCKQVYITLTATGIYLRKQKPGLNDCTGRRLHCFGNLISGQALLINHSSRSRNRHEK